MSTLNIPGGTTAATPATAAPSPNVRPVRAPKPADKHGWWWGTGRRKTAVARARIKQASGDDAVVLVSTDAKAAKDGYKTLEQYFSEERDRNEALSPLKLANMLGRFRVVLKMHGGGYMGQGAAAKLAIARALRDFDPALEGQLRDAGMLTRDAREVERKKYGQAGARRRFQFSKR
jgi:small subunit ribosomal protein S9